MTPLIAATGRLFGLMLVGLLPFIALAVVLGWQDVSKIAIYGFFVALLATLLSGIRTGMALATAFAGLAAAGVACHGAALGIAAIVGLSAALVPIFGRLGSLQAGIFAAMFVPSTFNPPPQPWAGVVATSWEFTAAVAALSLLGAIWGLTIAWALRRRMPPLPPGTRLDVPVAVIAGILVVLVASGVTFVSINVFPQSKWSWLLTAIYSMMMAAAGMTWRSSWDLVGGTLVGVLAAIAVVQFDHSITLMMLVGSLLLSTSIGLRVVGKPAWLAISLSTAGVVLLTGTGMDPVLAAEDRLAYTVAGAVIAVALGATISFAVRLLVPRMGAEGPPTRGTGSGHGFDEPE